MLGSLSVRILKEHLGLGDGDNFFRRASAPVDREEEINIRTLRVPQLKDECRRRNLSTAGRKADLIERIKHDNDGSYYFYRVL